LSPAARGPAPGPALDFGRALSFFFQDPKWVSKIAIGSIFSVLSMFVVGGVFISGYAVRLLRRSARGEPYPLPEWDDLGGMFVEGLQVMGVYLAHILPAVVAMMVLMVPVAIAGESRGDSPPALLLVVIPMMLLASLAFVAVLVYFPAALTRLAVEDRLGAAFEIGNNWAYLRRNFSNYLLAIVVFLVANFISQLGILAFCIGIFPATFWGLCAGAYALGEVAWRDPERNVPASA
jgi:hypothetical protein